jgi:spore coat polysaccharide biosynthesis protein SpsF
VKTLIIVQARMGSTRLPGKVLKTVLGKPLLAYQIERLQRVQRADGIVIATTNDGSEAPIVALCETLGVSTFRGSEEDVLARYHGAAKAHQADVVVRVTSDCPLIDPQVIDEVIDFYTEHQPQYLFVSNTLERTYPMGMDTEVFSRQILEEAFREAALSPEREHVTPFIYRRPERYPIGQVKYPKDYHHYRLTVDTPEDFALIEKILEALYPEKPQFTLEEILHVLAQHLDWLALNATVQQKQVSF